MPTEIDLPMVLAALARQTDHRRGDLRRADADDLAHQLGNDCTWKVSAEGPTIAKVGTVLRRAWGRGAGDSP